MSDDHHLDFDGIKYRIEKRPPMIFLVLFIVLVAWGVVFMAYYLFSGWSSEKEFAKDKHDRDVRLASQKTSAAPLAAVGEKEAKAMAEAGSKIFGERCAACHGMDAKGKIGPDLVQAQYKYGKTAEDIRHSINEGRPGGMPAFKNDLSAEKVESVVQYILSLKPAP